MLNWLHHLINPHCPHCIEERVCKACEILQYEVERLRADNQKLLDRVLNVPSVPPERDEAPEPKAIRPRATTWAIRKQMLEAEDREKLKLLSKAPVAQSTDDLEKELLNAEISRESEGK